MATFVKYRGAGKVPAKVVKRIKNKSGKVVKVKLMPRKDWRNVGEKLPITRTPNHVYHTSASIPRRKRSK